MEVGLDGETRHQPILSVDGNFSWLNKMPSKSSAQEVTVTAGESHGEGDGGMGSRPAEPRHAVALPIFAESGGVADVVGPELDQRGASPSRGQERTGSTEGGEEETEQDVTAHGCGYAAWDWFTTRTAA
jgi:hypothetical protein